MGGGPPIPISPDFFTQYPQIYINFLSISSSTGNFSIPVYTENVVIPRFFKKQFYKTRAIAASKL